MTDQIKKMVRESHVSIDPSVDQAILNDALGQLESQVQPQSSGRMPLRRLIMKRPFLKLSIAAMVILALVINLLVLDSSSNRIWAAVLENVRKANGFQCRTHRTTKRPGLSEQTVEGATYVSETFGLIDETYKDNQLVHRWYLNFDSNTVFDINYKDQTFQRRMLHETKDDIIFKINPKRLLLRVLEGEYRECGTRTVNGCKLVGIESHDATIFFGPDGYTSLSPGFEFSLKIWVNPENRMPVMMDSSYTRQVQNQTITLIGVTDQFQWNIEFSADLFKPDVPEGFTVVPRIVRASQARYALQVYAEYTQGSYPSRPDLNVIEHDLELSEKDIPDSQRWQGLHRRVKLDIIQELARFYSKMTTTGKSIGYFGDRVSQSDGDRILMYWQVDDANYAILRADLWVRDLVEKGEMTTAQLGAELFKSYGVSELASFASKQAYIDRLTLQHKQVVTIHVASETGDEPVFLAPVKIISLAEEDVPAESHQTDRFGNVNVELTWGDYQITATTIQQGEPIEYFQKISISPERSYQEVQFAIPAVPLVRGGVYYTNGIPVENASVVIGNRRVRTDRRGGFVIPAPEGDPNSYQLGQVFGNGTQKLFLWRLADKATVLNVELQWPCRIQGRLVDSHGDPLEHALLGLRAVGIDEVSQSWLLRNRVQTNSEGHFTFEEVPVGLPLSIVVLQPDDTEVATSVTLDEPQPDEVYDISTIVIK